MTTLAGIIVPAYIYPSTDSPEWESLENAARLIGNKLVVIANPNSGPGTNQDRNYVTKIDAVRRAGGKVIGYVTTDYLEPPRTPSSIEGDVDTWYSLYRIDGIFFDEVNAHEDKVPLYNDLYQYVQIKSSGAIVVNNFGVEPHEDYFGIGSSILCVHEDTFSQFNSWIPTWVVGKSTPERFFVIAYATSPRSLPTALNISRAKNIGWIYFTNDADRTNPFDTLPCYFGSLIRAIRQQSTSSFLAWLECNLKHLTQREAKIK